ncbi:GAF domain-like protein [Microthyrium microscopicum]|uniref:GAF domain-like protein n=1 Tax=Microthyrium microscopicum TaxID=703497 RepID=A0A6A6UCA2_9PEZI|nr:GAF domain-like protein [Microthyrium microscopicum]
MVHAEASTFTRGLSKREVYTQLLEQTSALFDNRRNWVCNLANTASILYHALHSLPAPSNAVNWAGFYIVYPTDPQTLVLGPFMGHVACQTIALGRGVCGAAAKKAKTQLVADVDAFPGHIACDGASKSEIVVPIVKDGHVRRALPNQQI